MPLGTLSMKTSLAPERAAALYAEAVATGSVGMETMMSGFLISTVSRSETCLSGLKFASVTATTLIPSLPNSLARDGFELGRSGASPLLAQAVADGREVTAETVVHAAQRGDLAARELVTGSAHLVGEALARIVNF